jgi:hypothetical protein
MRSWYLRCREIGRSVNSSWIRFLIVSLSCCVWRSEPLGCLTSPCTTFHRSHVRVKVGLSFQARGLTRLPWTRKEKGGRRSGTKPLHRTLHNRRGTSTQETASTMSDYARAACATAFIFDKPVAATSSAGWSQYLRLNNSSERIFWPPV